MTQMALGKMRKNEDKEVSRYLSRRRMKISFILFAKLKLLPHNSDARDETWRECNVAMVNTIWEQEKVFFHCLSKIECAINTLVMAFFGLTQVGYQNKVRQTASRPDYTEEQWRSREQKPGGTDITPLPPIAGYVPQRRSRVPINQTAGYGPGPGLTSEASWKEYMRLRTKHCRNPKGKFNVLQVAV